MLAIFLVFQVAGFCAGFFFRGHALAALFEAEAVAVHFQDVNVVGQPIQQGTRQAFGTEGLGPLIERQV